MRFLDRLYSIATAIGRGRSGVGWYTDRYPVAPSAVSIEEALGDATVSSCINLIAGVVAQLEFKSPDKAVNDLLHEPNAWQSPFEFFYVIAHDIKAFGNCYLRRFGTGDLLVSLAPMEARLVRAVAGPDGLPQYTSDGAGNKLGIAEVIHFRDIPSAAIQGPCRIEIGGSRIRALIEADAFIANHLKNGPAMRGVATFPGHLDAKKIKEYQAQLLEGFAQGGERQGGVLFLGGGASFNSLQMPIVDTSTLELRERLKAEVAALWGVPPFLAGASEANVKYSNQTAQHAAFYRDALAPTIKNICETLKLRLGADVICEAEGLLYGDMPAAIKAAKEAVEGGLMTQNEGRHALNLPRDSAPESDKLQTPRGNATGSMDPNRPRAGEDDDDE